MYSINEWIVSHLSLVLHAKGSGIVRGVNIASSYNKMYGGNIFQKTIIALLDLILSEID